MAADVVVALPVFLRVDFESVVAAVYSLDSLPAGDSGVSVGLTVSIHFLVEDAGSYVPVAVAHHRTVYDVLVLDGDLFGLRPFL